MSQNHNLPRRDSECQAGRILVTALAMVLWHALPASLPQAIAGTGSGFVGVEIAADEPRLPDAVRIGPLRRGADGQIERVDPTVESGSVATRCANGKICVGEGQAYVTLAAALVVARDADVIEVLGGIYHETAKITVKNLTIRGVGGQPHFDCAGRALADDKACLLLAADGITLENIEISGAVLPDGLGANGACVRNEPNKSFTLRRLACHGSQDGILSDGGTILIENSEFYDNGWTDRTHNVYFAGDCSVTVRGSIFRDARVGHEFKSRCYETKISDSTFISTKGSRNLDISDGGETLVYRSRFEKTRGADNYEIIAFAPESCAHPGDMRLKEVVVVSSQPEADIRNYNKCSGHPIIMDDVSFDDLDVKIYGYIKWEDGISDVQAPAVLGKDHLPKP